MNYIKVFECVALKFEFCIFKNENSILVPYCLKGNTYVSM